MSWGYWGIVTGLAVLVTTLLVCLDLVYSGSKTSPDESPTLQDQSGETPQQTASGSRLAA